MRKTVLIVDDEELIQRSLRIALEGAGYAVNLASSGAAALDSLRNESPDCMIIDLRLGDMNGLEVLEQARDRLSEAKTIVITAHGDLDSAVRALRLGAFDFIRKPFDLEEVIASVRNALRIAALEQRVAYLGAQEVAEREPQLIFASESMKAAVGALAKVAAQPVPVVTIRGETGTGKELAARMLHRLSPRARGPFIELNCSAIPEQLVESELFGHERGAFTGADKRKIGFFEAADGGTLFLDEIGDMPLTLQAKLLRVLERKVITRVGGTTEVPTDARLIAATHRDLDADVRAGRFRQDLLFRIGGFTIVVPPLRDRPNEVVPLAEHFARTTAAEQGRNPPVFADDARDALTGYTWPGNVRELRNAIERALVLCGDTLTAADLPDRLRDAGQRTRPVQTASDVRGHLAEVERAAIVAALEADGNNQTRAARRLGLSRRALIYKMEKYGLKPAPNRSDS